MQHETKFKNVVLRFLNTLDNTWYFKTNEVGRRGIPDIIACINGLFVAIENKTDTGIASPIQLVTLKKIKDRGRGISLVNSPDRWNELRCFLLLLSKDKGEALQIADRLYLS